MLNVTHIKTLDYSFQKSKHFLNYIMGNKLCKGGDTDSVISVPSMDSREEKRRNAVSHKDFDPEDDDDSDTLIVHPKTDSQKEKLKDAATRKSFLFTFLDDSQLKQVVDVMSKREVEAGEFLIQEGDDGECFFVINDGKFNALKYYHDYDEAIVVYKWEDTFVGFGESALVYRMLRPASVQALTDGSVWAIDRQTFKKIVISREYKKQKLYEAFLKNFRLLENLEKYERENLADAMQSRIYSAGEAVVREGDVADGMYFVESGTVDVLKQIEEAEEKVSEVGPGKYFGELGLITEQPRQAAGHSDCHG